MKTLLFYCVIFLSINACNSTQQTTAKTSSDTQNTVTKRQDTVTKSTTKNTQPLQEEIAQDNGIAIMYLTEEESLGEGMKTFTKLTISNKTNAPITLGMDYAIEQFKDGEWTILAFCKNLLFEEALYTLAPSKSKDFPFSFHKDLHTYEKGKYRIVKDYTTPSIDGKKQITLYTEFVVE